MLFRSPQNPKTPAYFKRLRVDNQMQNIASFEWLKNIRVPRESCRLIAWEKLLELLLLRHIKICLWTIHLEISVHLLRWNKLSMDHIWIDIWLMRDVWLLHPLRWELIWSSWHWRRASCSIRNKDWTCIWFLIDVLLLLLNRLNLLLFQNNIL